MLNRQRTKGLEPRPFVPFFLSLILVSTITLDTCMNRVHAHNARDTLVHYTAGDASQGTDRSYESYDKCHPHPRSCCYCREHKAWSQRIQSMITNDNSPKWELFREIPVDMDPPPQTSSLAASSSTSASKGAVAPPLQLRSPMLRPSVVPEVRMGHYQRGAFIRMQRVKTPSCCHLSFVLLSFLCPCSAAAPQHDSRDVRIVWLDAD